MMSTDTAFQDPEQGFVRVPPLQEQDQNRPGSHPVRRQAPLPGTPGYEHRHAHVHRPLWRQHPLRIVGNGYSIGVVFFPSGR